MQIQVTTLALNIEPGGVSMNKGGAFNIPSGCASAGIQGMFAGVVKGQ